MESPLRQRRTLLPDGVQEILDARVEKVVVVHRGIVADLYGIEDHIRRLGIDIRRLFPLGCGCGYGHAFPRALAATKEQLRIVSFEGISKISKEDMLRVFLYTVDFAREARGVLAFCERCVRKSEVGPRRHGDCFGEICTALDSFPGAKGLCSR